MGQLSGPADPAADAHWGTHRHRKGFFTDTSICIGCKACEVACKEWNHNPQDGDLTLTGMSYDNTEHLGASTWRHVAFIEQDRERIEQARESGRKLVDLGMPTLRPAAGHSVGGRVGADGPPVGGRVGADGPRVGGRVGADGPRVGGRVGDGPPVGGRVGRSASGGRIETPTDAVETTPPDTPEFRWLMASDVCKHCTHAGCLDVCPTGALFRTEFGSVVVQPDVCNGCGTCVAACPFGVIERRTDGTLAPKNQRGSQAPEVPNVGVAQKCTLCYDRLVDDEQPACAQTCPTESIKFGNHADLVATARDRVTQLHEQGRTEARLYGANELDGVGGTGSVFLLLDEPEVYGLPPDPRVPTADLPVMFKRAGLAAAGMLAAAAIAFAGGR